MILLTALNNSIFYLNPDLFERLEANPDTVITLTNGKKFVVKEKPKEVIDLIVNFRKRYMTNSPEELK